MHCKAWNYLFLRANGEYNCYCGPGENYVIFKDTLISTAPVNVVDNVVNGAYVAIRQKLKDGRIPFPDTCPHCGLFSDDEFQGLIYTDTIESFQVEPSFRCTLNCSICIPRSVRDHFPGPPDLPLEYFEKVVQDMAERHISIGSVAFCGKGEPLMNPHTPEMVSLVHSLFEARTSITTNGNIPWRDEIVTCGVNDLIFSIDGATSSSYRKYRDGNWRLAMENMAQAGKLSAPTQRVIWKYILFSHNDSNEELQEAKRIAEDIGVELFFDFTNAPNPSRRFKSNADLQRFWNAPDDYPDSNPIAPFTEKSLKELRKVHPQKIYIFGAGAIGLELKRCLEMEGIGVAGWIDSATHKQGTFLEKLQIHSPEDLSALDISAIILGTKTRIPEIKNIVRSTPVPVFAIDNPGY